MLDAIDELVARSKPCIALKRFHDYHRANPEVFDFIVAELRLRIVKGFTASSVHNICEYARWKIETDRGPGTVFSLNDRFAPFYARAVVIICPAYNGHVEFRRSVADGIFGVCLEPLPKKRRKNYARRLVWADGATIEDGWRPSRPHVPRYAAALRPDVHRRVG
jgi:hypothetical protein